MINSIYSKKISNDVQFPNVERVVHILADIRREDSIELICTIQYVKDSIDITHKFNPREIRLVADNVKRKTLYEADEVTPIMEEYEEQEVIDGAPQFIVSGENNEIVTPKMITKTKVKTIGLYDYFKTLMSKPVPTFSQYDATILLNAAQGKFDV